MAGGLSVLTSVALFFFVSNDLFESGNTQEVSCDALQEKPELIAKTFLKIGFTQMDLHINNKTIYDSYLDLLHDSKENREANEKRRQENIEIDKKRVNAQKFKDGKSCIHGSEPYTEQQAQDSIQGYHGPGVKICDDNFDHVKVNEIISKEFGWRCINKVCNFHHKRLSFVCSSTSNKPKILLLVVAIMLPWIHSTLFKFPASNQ